MIKEIVARRKAVTEVTTVGFLSSVPGWGSSTLMRQHWTQA
jgi:hypothetical protein